MKTIYNMTSGTFRKEIEDTSCDMQIQRSTVMNQMPEADLQMQEYTFDNVSTKSTTDTGWLLDIEVDSFINEMK